MTNAERIQKLEKEVATLKSVVANLVPVDNEGEYKDSLMRDLKKAEKSGTGGSYAGKGSLLKLLK